ncbi:DUF885 domain-containing protein [Hyalangium rubrum]|uniref:DUF885 domain-containing protein n=1 Tax=Hyalangium rubrum TaxID=3103134 RepID=A0ABU5H254_9BACT|nr:DUF885 domain-containing protein [Hyalangium sp. s54d21]MDY7227528.1 DUF885 domain-containing protein [Hyalangium sp. s54d21]
MRILSLAVAGLLSSSAWAATPTEDFQKLLDEHWAWHLKGNPIQATDLGVRDYDRELGNPSLAEADKRAREAQAFIARLDKLDKSQLSEADRVNLTVLRGDLAQEVEGNRFGQRTMRLSSRGGWHVFLARLPDMLPFYTKADYESYLARLEAYPAYNKASTEVTREALKGGYVQPCAPMEGFEKTITPHIVSDPTQSVFYQPFATKPASISEADWTALKTRAQTIIRTQLVPAYREFQTFYTKQYAPKCRKTVGASTMPGGKDYYAWRVRVMTTTDMTPEQIHQLGLSEVARIRAEMEQVIQRAGFKGDRKAYVQYLRTDPKHYPKTGEELMREASLLAKRIDGEMPKLFGRLPRLPYTVKEIPADIAEGTTTAYYEAGAAETGRAGVYRVNTSKLDQRPLFELPALTVHEAVPGHHQQLALQQELELPKFRRHAAFFTAFIEGWGLYSERLGIEMGLYDTPEKDFGRLSYEMWRACRLVVDTGMHAKGWTREQAIDFMLENTALSRHNIEAEVNRYITWPGQALAYKIGELKIRELRAKAERELGAKFDLRAFHDAVLENGAVPLDVLETHVNAWIDRSKKA